MNTTWSQSCDVGGGRGNVGGGRGTSVEVGQLTFLVLALELLDGVVDKTVVEVLQARLASITGGGVRSTRDMRETWDVQETWDAQETQDE